MSGSEMHRFMDAVLQGAFRFNLCTLRNPHHRNCQSRMHFPNVYDHSFVGPKITFLCG
jgi:hypothetical protein